MPNITQKSPYHDKLAQILSQRVLADIDNFADNFSVEETKEEFVLHIPQSFFIKQSNEQQAIRKQVEQAYGMVTVDTTGQDFDLMSFDVGKPF